MVLAAGRGERLRPLTDWMPKPLLAVGGQALIERHLLAIRAAGIVDVVINTAHLGTMIEEFVGDGSRWGVRVRYSREPAGALDTGGGIMQALNLLGPEPFLIVNGDVATDYRFSRATVAANDLAHLVLVPNPDHNPLGDFTLRSGRVSKTGSDRYTYAGVAVLHPALFSGCKPGRFPLAPLLHRAAREGAVAGELHRGHWTDVGTLGRLRGLERELTSEAQWTPSSWPPAVASD